MNYVIIGGNATGMSAASRLRKNNPDAKITVIEKGAIVSFGACGLPYYVGDEFNNTDEMIARSVDAFKKNNIDILLKHEALEFLPEEKKVMVKDLSEYKTKTFTYDKLIISTGAHPIIPPFAQTSELKGIHTLTKMEDGIAIKEALRSVKKVVIIGGGFIGIELAEAMRHQDKTVTLIERSSRINNKAFDSEMTEHLESALIESGVQLQLNEAVLEFKGTDSIQQVITDRGVYNADMVVLAIGFAPSTVWCKHPSLKTLPNGAIIIDEYGQTSIPDVYSGGDCATVRHFVSNQDRYIPLATTANKIGRLIGDTLSGKPRKFQGALGSSAIRYMDLEIGRTGLGEQEAKDLGINYGVNIIKDFNHTSYVPNRTHLYIKLIYDKDSRVLLGGQIAGHGGAVLRTDVLAIAIFKQMTVDELGMMDLIYAPPFSRTWDALNVAGNTCK